MTCCPTPEHCLRADQCLGNCKPTPSIVRSGDGRFFRVTETNNPDLQHVWMAKALSCVRKNNTYVERKGPCVLLRKIGCTVVEWKVGHDHVARTTPVVGG